MKSTVSALWVLAMMSGAVWAQGVMTVITRVDGREVEAKQVPAPLSDAFNSFEETDANGDGLLTPAEAHEAGILEFARADANKDGILNPREYYEAAGISEAVGSSQ
jgi:hypothetical protein